MENMLLAAHGIGLGAVWCAIYPASEYVKLFSDLLNLPHSVIPVGMMVVGNPAETRTVTDRYNKSRVHTDRW
jgi:nitroreductase